LNHAQRNVSLKLLSCKVCMCMFQYLLLFICGAGLEPSPLLLRSFVGPVYEPWMIDGDYCGPGETEVLEENLTQCLSVHRRSHRTFEARTRAATVESRRLTASATARHSTAWHGTARYGLCLFYTTVSSADVNHRMFMEPLNVLTCWQSGLDSCYLTGSYPF
jgi:hypothetical protein